MSIVSGRVPVARGSNGPYDGSNQIVCILEVGSCSLQEEQMLRRSVEALVRRGNGHGDRLPQSPRPGFAPP